MNSNYYDIIIVGSGMAGLYSAYNIKHASPSTSFLILEKHKKEWIGGRANNEMFYGTNIVTGAGVGRFDANPLLIKWMKELNIHYEKFTSIVNYSETMDHVDIMKMIELLKIEYEKHPELHKKTFKQFFIKILGKELYRDFITSAGYTDYENADIAETLFNYGMDDNKGGWTGLHIPWREMVHKLYDLIGHDHFKFSEDVLKINKIQNQPCLFEITTKNKVFYSNKVIIATTISGIKELVSGASNKNSLYQQIHGQPFLRLYAKFDKKSSIILKNYVQNYTIVPGNLQKIIPMNHDKGVYMIAYSDNDNAIALKNYLQNTPENREFFSRLVENSLGITDISLNIIAIKDFYWHIGTHYYEPLKHFATREEFVFRAQHPEQGMLVVGEAVSRYQGWVEGALGSVKAVLNKKWIETVC